MKHDVQVSEATQAVLKSLHEKVCWAVERSLEAVATANMEMAKEVRAAKPEINQLAKEADDHLTHRLASTEPNRFAAFRIESEIVEYLKRVYYFAKRISRVMTKGNVAQAKWQLEVRD